jgi:hypothetical protein
MLQRSAIVVTLLLFVVSAAPVPARKTGGVNTVAPTSLPHPVAMFLANLSGDGKQRITFKAAAIGTRFFFEEATGVTVYGFDGTAGYRKEQFLKGYTLPRALKKYGR